MSSVQLWVAALGLIREILKYLREHKKNSPSEAITSLDGARESVRLAVSEKKDLNLTL